MQVEGKTKEVFALADGKGKIRYVESDPLPDSTRFVRITKTEKGLNKLEPADTTTNNDRKPVSKETGFILFLKEYLYKHLPEIALH